MAKNVEKNTEQLLNKQYSFAGPLLQNWAKEAIGDSELRWSVQHWEQWTDEEHL